MVNRECGKRGIYVQKCGNWTIQADGGRDQTLRK